MGPAPDDRARAAAVRRRLSRSSRAARRQLAATVALGALQVALIVAQATILAYVIAGAFTDGLTLEELAPELIVLVALALCRGLVAAGFEFSGRVGATKVMGELRAALTTKLLRGRPGALQGERAGELAATAVQGVDALESYFARYLPQVVLAALAPLGILAWTAPRDLEATLILALTFPLIPIFMVLIGRRTETVTRRRWRTLSRLSSHFLDVVTGIETLRAHGRIGPQVETIGRAGERFRSETMGTLRIGFLSALVLELLAMLGTALVAATVGVQLAAGSLGLEAGLTVLLLAPELYLPLRQAGAQFHASTDGMAAAERIYEVLDLPDAVTRPAHPRPCPDPATEPVSFREVSFAYPERGVPVLRDVSFTLEPGETVALAGPSGCGKSTVAMLLLRLLEPDRGGVLCGGVDLRGVDPEEWRRRVAWVPQRPTIFSASVADNVRLAHPGATGERVSEALEAADALAFAEELPQGIDTLIGDGGRALSAGQASRIALARAFLSDAPLVVLDEPTAHLDAASADLVSAAAERLTTDRAALFIAHRPRLVANADKVVALEAGRSRERAPGAEVPR